MRRFMGLIVTAALACGVACAGPVPESIDLSSLDEIAGSSAVFDDVPYETIRSGGEGKRTWTGISLQVADVIVGARAVAAAGGSLAKEPEPENGEPPHLAMCADPDGNEFMLTRKRG